MVDSISALSPDCLWYLYFGQSQSDPLAEVESLTDISRPSIRFL